MRSRNTLKKVANNPTPSSKCCDIMQSYLQAGQVEQLAEPLDLNTQTDSESYIPAFPVSNKSNKVR